MNRACLLVALGLSSVVAHARTPVEDLRPLLSTALQLGRAEGVLVGPVAAALSRSFATDAPLLVDVEWIEPLSPYCARLRVTNSQAQVRDTDQRVRDRRFSYQLEFCADGRVRELALPGEVGR